MDLEKQEKQLQYALAMKRLDVELKRERNDRPRGDQGSLRMKHLMHPYVVGEGIGFFLVDFKWVCEIRGGETSWPQRLRTVLPYQGADVIARLFKDDATY